MSVQEADLSLTQMAMGAGEGRIDPAQYQNLFVRFVMHPHPDRKETQKQGRPIFKEIPYVDIRTPGDRTSHIFRPVNDLDKQKWPKHWEAFLSKKDQPQEGMPLEHWPLMNRAMVEELKYFGIRTVEQLAHMNDSSAQNFMGIRAWMDKAQAFLAVSKKSSEAEKIALELSKRDREINELREQLKTLQIQIGNQGKLPQEMQQGEEFSDTPTEPGAQEPDTEPDKDLLALQALAGEAPDEPGEPEGEDPAIPEEADEEGI